MTPTPADRCELPANGHGHLPQPTPARPGDPLRALWLALLLGAETALRGPDTTPTPPAEVRRVAGPEPRGQT